MLRTLLKYGMSQIWQSSRIGWNKTMLPQIERSRLLLCVQSLLRGMLFHQCTYFQGRDFGTTHSKVAGISGAYFGKSKKGVDNYRTLMAG